MPATWRAASLRKQRVFLLNLEQLSPCTIAPISSAFAMGLSAKKETALSSQDRVGSVSLFPTQLLSFRERI